uniref:Fibronectin n=1 Tax=Eptatretus burgeri TaxID=7764 RepID=A0A8C4NAG0_EPTBU
MPKPWLLGFLNDPVWELNLCMCMHVCVCPTDNCKAGEREYFIGQQWRHVYRGQTLLCQCYGGDRGWTCEASPQTAESCFDQYTGERHAVGDTWERPKDDMIWDCTCLGEGRGRISCTVANRCHDDGQSYKIGDKWRKPHEMGRYMLECVCLGYNRGEWNCAPLSGSQERCYDSTSRTTHNVGDKWEKPHQRWMIVDCTCLGEGQGRISCTSRNRCNDKLIQRSFKIGDRWSRVDSHGHLLNCLCIGNNQGEMTCERQSSAVIAHVQTSIQTSVYETTVQCESESGIVFVSGQKWIKTRSDWRFLCSCQASGVTCRPLVAQTHNGNSDGAPCMFPFIFKGQTYNTCTLAGRSDGQYWCSTTADFSVDQNYSFCKEDEGKTCWFVKDLGGNSNGAICHFPYLLNGVEHFTCTDETSEDGMAWCGTTSNFDVDKKYGYCPLNADEICIVGKKQRHVGDLWDEFDELGNKKRCTCIGKGRGKISCTLSSQNSDQCQVDEKIYYVNQSFFKHHKEGHMMNCTCLGQTRGLWKCDAMDQCQDKNTQKFYQIGESWSRILQGTQYLCMCHGLGVGEWTCNPQTATGESLVFVTDASQANSHPIQWDAGNLPHVTGYILKWKPKGVEGGWSEVVVPAGTNTYTIKQLRAGVTYEGQLITLLAHGTREVTRFEFTTSLITRHGGEMIPTLTPLVVRSEMVTEITSSSFVVSWVSASTSSSGFRVEYELSEEGAETQHLGSITFGPIGESAISEITLPKEVTLVKLQGLQPSVVYNISIMALVEDQESAPLFIEQATKRSEPPTNLQFVAVTDSRIVVMWEAPKVEHSGFRVVIQPKNVPHGPHPLELPLTQQTFTEIDHLQPGTTYRFEIYAVYHVAGQESPPLIGEQTTTLDQPINLRLMDATQSAATVTWTAPKAPLTHYHLTCGPTLGGQPKTYTVAPDATQYTVRDLESDVEYSLILSAMQNLQRSQPAVLTFSTRKCFAKPSNTVYILCVTKLLFIFGVIVQSTHPYHGQKIQEKTSKSGYIIIDGLNPGEEYTVTISVFLNGQEVQEPTIHKLTTSLQPPRDIQVVINSQTGVPTLTWKGVPGVTGYRVQGVPIPGQSGETEERVVGPEQGFSLLDRLTPGVEYLISVLAFKGDEEESLPISTVVTTVIPPPTDLSFSAVSTESFHISWKPPHGVDVEAYSIRFAPLRDVTNWSQVTITDKNHRAEIHGLTPGKEYLVSVHSMIGQHESVALSGTQKTDIDPPTNMVFSNVKDSTFTVHWESPRAPITGYRALYSVETLGPLREELLPSDQNFITFTELYPSTEYTVSVFAVADDRESWPLTGKQLTKTSGPTDLVFSEKTPTSFIVSWNPPPISVRHYRLNYKETGSQRRPSELSIPSGRNSAVIRGLLPGREYRVALHSVTSRGDNPTISKPLLGIEKTDVDTPKHLEFTNVGQDSFTLTWKAPQGPLTGYRVKYYAFDDDVLELSPAPQRHEQTAVLTGLQLGTEYTVAVSALYGPIESKPAVGTQATVIPPPTFLQFPEVTPTSITVQWPPGAPSLSLSGYRVVLTPKGPDASTKYNVLVYALKGEQSSEPVEDVISTMDNIQPPRKLKVMNVTDNSIKISWHARKNPSISFLITAKPTMGLGLMEKTTGPDSRLYTIEGLEPGTDYIIKVYSIVGSAKSPPAEVIAKTAIDAPTDLQLESATTRTISLSWKPPLAHITGYRVFYSSPRRHRQRLSPSPGPFENQITLHSKYQCSILNHQSTKMPEDEGQVCFTAKTVFFTVDRRYQPRRQPNRFSAKVPHIGQIEQFHLLPSLAPPSPGHYQMKHNPRFQIREMAAPRYGNINTPARDAAVNPHQAVHTGAFQSTPQQVVWAPGAEATLKPPTISWSTLPDATEYIVSCFPLSGIGSSLELRFPAKTTSATLTGLVKGLQYSVVVEAIKGGARYRIHEEVLKTPGAHEDFCLDTITHTYYAVGQDWERLSHRGLLLYCRCLGYGHGHYRCDSSRWCHDNGKNYNEGDKWDRPAENGQMQSCICLGRGIGEYKCEAHHASCYDEGHMYEAGEQWQKMYRGDLCSCTCLGGQQGWHCEDCHAVVEDVVPDTRHHEKSQPRTIHLDVVIFQVTLNIHCTSVLPLMVY